MKKPQKIDYGWNEDTGWTQGDKARFEYDTETWRIVNRKPGRQRARPIHPSWENVLMHFDATNPKRSQNAFCAWAGIKPATFSNWKNKPLTDDVERWILEWDYIGDGQGLDGSQNTNQHRVASNKLGKAAKDASEAIKGFTKAIKIIKDGRKYQ